MIVGIDPGPTRSAFAMIECLTTGPAFVHGEHRENRYGPMFDSLFDARAVGATVALETIVGFAYEAKRVQALVETARVEGRFLALADGLGVIMLPISAGEWRGELCGSRTASDEQIRIVVEGVVAGLPRTNEHVRDAIGIALVAAMRANLWHGKLSADVRVALMRQQAADKARRGTPKAKRVPTRAQSKRRSVATTAAWSARRP